MINRTSSTTESGEIESMCRRCIHLSAVLRLKPCFSGARAEQRIIRLKCWVLSKSRPIAPHKPRHAPWAGGDLQKKTGTKNRNLRILGKTRNFVEILLKNIWWTNVWGKKKVGKKRFWEKKCWAPGVICNILCTSDWQSLSSAKACHVTLFYPIIAQDTLLRYYNASYQCMFTADAL